MEVGTYQVTWVLSGYNELKATMKINPSGEISCVTVDTGLCGGSGTPRVSVAGNVVTGYLKQTGIIPPPVNNFYAWVDSKGSKAGLLSNLSALLEICDAYLGFVQIGFTVTLSDLLTTCDYYLGFG